MSDDHPVEDPLPPLTQGFEFWDWQEPGDADPPYWLATYRIPGGLACSLWLRFQESGWAIEGLTLHPEARNVAVGPWRQRPHNTAALAAQTTGPARPLSARLLRQIPLGEIETDLRERLARSYYMKTYRTEETKHVQEARRRRKSDRFYVEIAEQYDEAMRSGTNQPAQQLIARHGVPEGTMYRWINAARRRGLLSETGRGRAGGYLTEKAKKLLERSDDE
jgi:transposase-like protein